MANSVNGWSVSSTLPLNKNPFPGTKIVPVPGVRTGDVAAVLHYVGSQFNSKVEKLYNPGCWGFAYKRLGTTSWSNHASGTAIDLNAPSHPWKKKGTFNSKQVAEIKKILAFLGGVVQWGGNWSDAYVDEMHFEIVGNAAQVKSIAQKIAKGVSDPMADKIDIFRNVFITVNAKWPTNAEIEAYKKHPEFAKNRPYTYVQQKYMYPNWVKKSQYDTDLSNLTNQLSTMRGELEKVTAQAKTQIEVNNTLADEIEAAQDKIGEQAKQITDLKAQLSMPPQGPEKPANQDKNKWSIEILVLAISKAWKALRKKLPFKVGG